MIKVVPFIQTTGGEKFKQFLALPFTIDILYPAFNEKSCETLFEGWHYKNMMNWHKFTNDDKIILEFYPKHYVIYKNVSNTVKYILSIPITINDFINDMQRFGVQLYWTDWIDKNFEPKEYLHANEIKNYYIDLLGKMGKSNELQ
jgi:hypothetical protein